ncbi:MAG TPA: glycoside hydrolase N-terminal domain-containing protein [Bryobacteraceae bacterium]|nr:glycoside hydrolase N-terminal domain-containing protein [Bryobacteraceae bacterium]
MRTAASLFFLAAALSAQPIQVHLPEAAHGLSFDTPAKVWDEALPLGNGMIGALVWGDGKPLRISLDRADLWDLRPVPEFHSAEYSFAQMKRWHEEGRVKDLKRVYEDPYNRAAPTKIPAGRIEITFPDTVVFRSTGLSLADAVGTMRFADGTETRIFTHAIEPVGMALIRGAKPSAIKLQPPPFTGTVDGSNQPPSGNQDLRLLGYPAPVETSGETWRSYFQKGAEGFEFAIHMEWRDTPGGRLICWSVASGFEGPDPLDRAEKRVKQALAAGFDTMLRSHRQWWLGFWGKSSLRVPNRAIERQWYLDTYKFGAASRRGAPPITLQAVWTADTGKTPPWKGDYHHDLNTQLSYWPCYSGNRLEDGLAYLDWLWKTRNTAFDWTKRFFGLPGLNVPMTADLAGQQIGGWRQYTHSATTAAWLAHHFYLHWKYSADREFLRDRAYPYLRDAATFIEAFTAKKDASGKRTHPLSSSPEIHDNRPEAWFPTVTNYDLALDRWLLQATAELAAEVGRKDEEAHWKTVLSEFPAFMLDDAGGLLVAAGHPLRESHRHFSHLMAIHPLGLYDWENGEPDRRIIRASLADLDRLGSSRWCGYSFSWLGNMAARARDGERAAKALEIFATAFTLRNSFHANGDQSGKGYSTFTYRPFTLEGNFAAAAGTQEMLLQSHAGKIILFPAIPASWRDAEFRTLRAEGAFLISARRNNGAVTRVEIVSEAGGTCRLVSPFSGRELAFRMKAGERKILTGDPKRP